jgi:hypothetical protein
MNKDIEEFNKNKLGELHLLVKSNHKKATGFVP